MSNYNVQIACGPARHEGETLSEYLNRTSKNPVGVWDERRKTFILPSGTVAQGRRPMFKPFTKAERAAQLAAIADKVHAASEPTEHDCPKCGEHFSTCVCEPDLEKAEQQQTQKENTQ